MIYLCVHSILQNDMQISADIQNRVLAYYEYLVRMNDSYTKTTTHHVTWCVYDQDHMSALRIKNRSESDPRSYEATKAVEL